MLLQSKNIFSQIANNDIVISPVFFWVFAAIVVGLFIYFLRKTTRLVDKANAEEETVNVEQAVVQEITHNEMREEEATAIAMALYLYKKEFDRKAHFKSTLQRVSKVYSPWNSKIYTLREYPRK